MLNKQILYKLLATGLLAFVSACGGGDAGGVGPYITEFKTVYATASQPAPQTVDIMTGNTCPTPIPPDGSRASEKTTVTITVTRYPSSTTSTNTPLTLDIGQATVTFEALTPGAPIIHPVTAASSSRPGATGSVPVEVQYFPADRKDATFNSLICTSTLSYRYNVTVSFPATENGSNESKTIVARFPMEIRDQP